MCFLNRQVLFCLLSKNYPGLNVTHFATKSVLKGSRSCIINHITLYETVEGMGNMLMILYVKFALMAALQERFIPLEV